LWKGKSGVFKVEKNSPSEIFALKAVVAEKKSTDDKKEIESQMDMSMFQFYLHMLWFTRASKSVCFEIS
jgi:hypothetical protein